MPDDTDAFGRPLRPEGTGWAPPVAPPERGDATWAPPSGAAPFPESLPAGWWQRAGATILDGLLISVTGVLAATILAAALDAGEDATTAIAAAFGVVVSAIYYGLLMSRGGDRNGQTWGKQATGIRVVRTDGQPMTVGYALLRELLVKTLLFGYAAVFTLYLATLLNYLWPLWDAQNRALHDRVARSLVRKV